MDLKGEHEFKHKACKHGIIWKGNCVQAKETLNTHRKEIKTPDPNSLLSMDVWM